MMKILDTVLGVLLIGLVIVSLFITPINLPHKVVQKYNGYVVTDKENLWLMKSMTVATDDSVGSFCASDLVYETWTIGDTIR